MHITAADFQSFGESVLGHNWKMCVGTGRLGLALQKEYLEHLEVVQRDIHFSYIRGHGLFSDDIGIYREVEIDGVKQPFYNFTYIDRIFDSFLDLGIRPFLELGFMPQDLASSNQTVFYWKGNVTPPADYDKWERLVKTTLGHFLERYGVNEVLKWPIEVWNEPNLVNFWSGANQVEYFRLYEVTAHAVKAVHGELQVGGPAICGGADEWIEAFLKFCSDRQVPVDFVSRHAYTSAPPTKKTFEYYYQDLAEPEDMLKQFSGVRDVIKRSPFPQLPLYITEYNTSYNPTNPIHDTVFNAAYVARILSEAGDYADAFSYWTFSDVFEESDVPKAQFHGGFGLIALHSIPKPTFHLFAFFNRLGNTVLYRDRTMLITRREDKSIVLIAWNLVWGKDKQYDLTIDVDLPVAWSDSFVLSESIDEHHGNAWAVWRQLGRPRFPSREDVSILNKAARPRVDTWREKTQVNCMHLRLILPKNGVKLVTVQQIHDETPTYAGLDDSLLVSYNEVEVDRLH
nr:xylan 1,4-beta-xylosidase [Alicyclobacillus sp. SO9]